MLGVAIVEVLLVPVVVPEVVGLVPVVAAAAGFSSPNPFVGLCSRISDSATKSSKSPSSYANS
jgi:hypothetical protein